MSDFLDVIAAHLNAEPSMCACGHPSVLHADGVGCTARFVHDSGSDACPCERMTEGCGEDGRGDVVLIYGSRTWTDRRAIARIVCDLDGDIIIVHGGAQGADMLADQVAALWGLTRRVYPADWVRYGRRAGPIRNQQMIDREQPSRAFGFRSAGESRGTDDMTRRLEAAGIPHEVITEQDATRPPTTGRDPERRAMFSGRGD